MKYATPFRCLGPRLRNSRLVPGLLAATMLAGCMVGPDYHRPAAISPAMLKEMTPPPGWAFADPHYAELPKGAWWTLYNDPVLTGLESQIDVSNQTIKADEAAYRQARALVDEARAGLFPTITATPSFTRSGTGTSSSGGSIGAGSSTLTGAGVGGGSSEFDRTSYELQGSVDWQIDVWGQIRRQVESSAAAAQVSAATLAAARLSIQTTLATDYFELRYEDSLQTLLDKFVTYYTQAEVITRNSTNAGVSAPSDLLQAEVQLETTRAQSVAVGIARAQYEHAIAVLTGHPPSDLSLTPGALTTTIPAIPVTVPSQVLQRRPDIAEGERTMEEENALIGVAIAAYYPVISLSAAAGYAGDPLGSLIKVANRFWSLGATAVQTLFNGGERSAAVRAARAVYDESVANYRQTVLAAFQSLEDDLSNLRILARESDAQVRADELSDEAVRVAFNEYTAGTTIYTTVITSQTTALSNDETELSIQENRVLASVSLINDLGGGWNASDIPSKASYQTDDPFLPSFIQKDRN
ncbi:efflux transporter outer membrane subunit [Lichenicola sp.]|uniref:efflux transporter outer membrane subunit n=1 Tax=Lichenicola sp. TaxID=2804529 RepID=UPI003B00FB53